MGDACEPYVGDVARRGVDPLQVPDGLPRLGEDVGQKATAVLRRENSRVSPLLALERTDIQNVDDENVARLRTFDRDCTGQVVTWQQVAVTDVVGAVVV